MELLLHPGARNGYLPLPPPSAPPPLATAAMELCESDFKGADVTYLWAGYDEVRLAVGQGGVRCGTGRGTMWDRAGYDVR